MKTFILLASVDKNERKTIENIENNVYKSMANIIELIENDLEDSYVYTLSDFMDSCNDQEINLENYWLTYIHLK